MKILARHEAAYFLWRIEVPEKPDVAWSYHSGDTVYHLHVSKSKDGGAVIFFVGGDPENVIAKADVHSFGDEDICPT